MSELKQRDERAVYGSQARTFITQYLKLEKKLRTLRQVGAACHHRSRKRIELRLNLSYAHARGKCGGRLPDAFLLVANRYLLRRTGVRVYRKYEVSFDSSACGQRKRESSFQHDLG
jgi:hypothetical protein